MNVIEIHGCTKLIVRWSRKEVQAPVPSKDIAGLLYHCCHRRIAEYIVVPGAAGDREKLRHGILTLSCVDEMQ